MYLLVYVDDIILINSSNAAADRLLSALTDRLSALDGSSHF